MNSRQCGILLHPTSLPSSFGIGDFGLNAYQFIDFLYRSGQKLWQVLPLNPVGYGESPYQGLSAFAGNPLLISIEGLVDMGLLDESDITDKPFFDQYKVEFKAVKEYKVKLFKKAFENFQSTSEQYWDFRGQNQYWLEDYALFMSLKEYFNEQPWNRWPQDVASKKNKVINYYKSLLAKQIDYNIFLQYIFYSQWLKLKNYANQKGIKIIGDLPIYVAYDSADTWAHQGLFKLDTDGLPTVVSGVPPDYFSATGQLWGNPIYDWREMGQQQYYWWQQRFTTLLQTMDIIRVDHFRGFEAYWEVPYGEKTAVKGRWVKAPGEKLFTHLKKQLGQLSIIAEDLGIITPSVEKLKNKFGFPGMKVLHFTLTSDRMKDFSPYHYDANSVIYTGTHDNDTTVGWLKNKLLPHSQLEKVLSNYFHIDISLTLENICWRIIEIAYQSPVNTVIIPLQDVLALDTRARMNYPGTVGDNWDWRFSPLDLTHELEKKLNKMVLFYNR